MKTGWRDLIVTSKTCREDHFEDIEDFGPRYENKSSLSIDNSPQNPKQQKTSPISSKSLPLHVADAHFSGAPAQLNQGVQECMPPPLLPGWLVAYRDQQGRLRGGCDDREHGTVAGCEWDGWTWIITLTNGDTLPIRQIASVGKTDRDGRVIAAWSVREHGFDGEGISR